MCKPINQSSVFAASELLVPLPTQTKPYFSGVEEFSMTFTASADLDAVHLLTLGADMNLVKATKPFNYQHISQFNSQRRVPSGHHMSQNTQQLSQFNNQGMTQFVERAMPANQHEYNNSRMSNEQQMEDNHRMQDEPRMSNHFPMHHDHQMQEENQLADDHQQQDEQRMFDEHRMPNDHSMQDNHNLNNNSSGPPSNYTLPGDNRSHKETNGRFNNMSHENDISNNAAIRHSRKASQYNSFAYYRRNPSQMNKTNNKANSVNQGNQGNQNSLSYYNTQLNKTQSLQSAHNRRYHLASYNHYSRLNISDLYRFYEQSVQRGYERRFRSQDMYNNDPWTDWTAPSRSDYLMPLDNRHYDGQFDQYNEDRHHEAWTQNRHMQSSYHNHDQIKVHELLHLNIFFIAVPRVFILCFY